jgi:membrane-associated protease RseP (regulator of RpoE activity)
MFVDPKNGDFRVKEGSPALKLGFKNFPMDQFGVKKPSLKAIAKTPEMPTGQPKKGKSGPVVMVTTDSFWLGVKLQNLKGEEFSAFGTRKEDGGVALSKVPAGSAAASAGLKEGDLVQSVNGKKTKTIADLLTVLAKSGDAPLKLKVVRNQAVTKLTITPAAYVLTESTTTDSFSKLELPTASGRTITANVVTGNSPLSSLTDGKLAKNYGPVFANGIHSGAYKMDLGSAKSVAAITSWSHNQGNSRGAQRVTLYGSNAASDPGWNLKKYTALSTIDTTGIPAKAFNAASLRARKGNELGEFRWIVWSVSPVSKNAENSAFQELSVELIK